jgi:hypothetical protein
MTLALFAIFDNRRPVFLSAYGKFDISSSLMPLYRRYAITQRCYTFALK